MAKKKPVEEAEGLPAPSEEKPQEGLTQNEMTMAALAHASVVLTFVIALGSGGLGSLLGILVPLLIWLTYKEKSAYVSFQALQATVFQVVSILLMVVVLATAILIGLCLMPFALLITVVLALLVLILPLAQLGYGLYAAYETYQGRDFRYWLVGESLEKEMAKRQRA
jgi:uncharacterized Tic20 family protein